MRGSESHDEDGYEPDEDRAVAQEAVAAPSKEIANLKKYSKRLTFLFLSEIRIINVRYNRPIINVCIKAPG